MRYTSESTMDDQTLRDVERWKDKIEVRLDNRQVFFLFFGSALVACLLFILGVIVGKRLESRGRAVVPEIEDPLALLDKVASTPRTGPEPAPALPRMLFRASNAPKPAAAAPGAKVAAPAAPNPAPQAKAPVVVPPKAEPAPKPIAIAKAEPAPKLETAKPAVAPAKKVALVTPTPAADPAKAKGRFTLQLGSFPDRAEAEAFSRRF